MKLGDSMDKKLFKSILLLITYTVVLVMVLSRLGLIAGGVAWVLGLAAHRLRTGLRPQPALPLLFPPL